MIETNPPNIELGEEFEGIRSNVFIVGGEGGRNQAVEHFHDVSVESTDIDLLLAGVDPQEMKERGFNHIMSGNTTEAVFQDSQGREVALPNGDGENLFGGFKIADPSAPLLDQVREDLSRRDLTMNAMAIHLDSGEVFDPFDGIEDIKDGVIRHIDGSFMRDPLRVLRAIRFSTRFSFIVDGDTFRSMKEVSDKLAIVTGDRVGSELVKVLKQGEDPSLLFVNLKQINALEETFPELAELVGVPAGPQKIHKEGDAFDHTMSVLTEMMNIRGNDVEALLMALTHDLGKAKTDEETLPHHHGHAKRGVEIASQMQSRLALNRDFEHLMKAGAREHMRLHSMRELNAGTIIDIVSRVESRDVLDMLIDLEKADARGRIPMKDPVIDEEIEDQLHTALSIVDEINGEEALNSRGLDTSDIGSEIEGREMRNIIKQDRVEEFRKRVN